MSSICIKCKKEHNGSFGSGKFCSRSCSNGRVWSENDKKKKSISALKNVLNGKWGCLTDENRSKRIYKSKSWAEKVLERPFNDLSRDYKRQRVLLDQNYKCAKCEIKDWQGIQLALELDHKDGNNSNDSRENLHAICPNCHSITNNFRGRNKIRGKFPTDLDFYKKYKETGTIRQTLLSFGLAAKGANYEKAKHIILRLEPQRNIITIVQY